MSSPLEIAVPDPDERAAIELVRVAIELAGGQYREQQTLSGWNILFRDVVRNTAGSTGVSDYIVARQFALNRQWITGLGNEYAVTSEGRRVYELMRTGKYKGKKNFEYDFDSLKAGLKQHPIVSILILFFTVSAFGITFYNSCLDAIEKSEKRLAAPPKAPAIQEAEKREAVRFDSAHVAGVSSNVVQKPDINLELRNVQTPYLVLLNSSDSLAREVKWMFALWNIDDGGSIQPLPIQIQTFDWIRAGDSSGPQEVFSPAIIEKLKVGNRIVGSMSELCPDCARGRTYLISIRWRERGWYVEVPASKNGDLLVPDQPINRASLEKFFDKLERIPEAQRLKIL